MSARVVNNNTVIQKKTYFLVSCCQHILQAQRPGSGDACQSGKMVTLFNSLSSVLKILFLHNYGVKHYDYNVKRSGGVA